MKLSVHCFKHLSSRYLHSTFSPLQVRFRGRGGNCAASEEEEKGDGMRPPPPPIPPAALCREARGRKRRTDNHLQRERQSKIERRWRSQRPLPPSLFLFLPRAFFLFLFMDSKGGGGEEGEWGALFLPPPSSHAIPIPLLLFSCSQGTCLTFPNSSSTFFSIHHARVKKIFQSPSCLFFPRKRKTRAGKSDIFAHPFRHKCRYRAKLGRSSYLS